MDNLSMKNLPNYAVEFEAEERARRARMRASREEFRQFVKSLPDVGDSTELIREDREREQ
jgi:hypothetical protein